MEGSPVGVMVPLSPLRPGLVGALVLAASIAPGPRGGSAPVPEEPPFVVADRFGRALHDRGVLLVDWEGVVANPRVRLTVAPGAALPADRYPLRVTVRTSDPRLLLERFSVLAEDGSTRVAHLERPGDVAAFDLAVFPDDDGADEQHELVVVVEDAAERPWRRVLAVHVEDRDVERAPGLAVQLDFSADATGFFADEAHRAVVARAAAELGDLLDDQGFAEVPAEAETSWVWSADGFGTGHEVTNPAPYTGFRVLVHGIHHEAGHSGSCASDRRPEALQRRGDATVGLRRSGTIAIETSGNWNGRGWHVDGGDPTGWLRSRNLEADPHDLLSVARHELLHALVYHRAHPGYAALVQDGKLAAPALAAYLGAAPGVDASEHLCETVDPVSGFGAFGNEYGTVFPWRRWLPTKLDLLVLEAAGYRLRPHSCLVPLALGAAPTEAPLELTAAADTPLELPLGAQGGVPPYCVALVEGALPDGLTLDGWTGTLRGQAAAGAYPFTLRLDDQDRHTPPVERRVELAVAAAPPAPVEAGAPAEDTDGEDAAATNDVPATGGDEGGTDPPPAPDAPAGGEPPPGGDAKPADEPPATGPPVGDAPPETPPETPPADGGSGGGAADGGSASGGASNGDGGGLASAPDRIGGEIEVR